jgi:hypothetical protein
MYMLLKLSDHWLIRPTNTRLWIYFSLSLLLAIAGYIAVEISFARTKYPVSLLEGQLAFSGAAIKSHYASLQAQGTFDQFVLTQIIDFAWIIGLMLTLFFSHLVLARSQPPKSKWCQLALRLAVLAPIIAASDAFENMVSFVMLANPKDFSDWLAILYSSFAAIKWSWATIGIVLLLIQIGALIRSRARQKQPAEMT